MNAIVVVDQNWAIGKDNGLLVHLPGDLAYFKSKTLNKAIVMGRKTLESMPGGKPLPGRTTIVLSRNSTLETGCRVCGSEEELQAELKKYETEDVFIAGGENIYAQFINQCDTYYVTKIFAAFDADRYFPNLDEMPGLYLAEESDIMEEKGIKYQFVVYRKK